jgi:anti-sigma28 factor (negative regulator of flagellin synthesis)
MMIKNTTSVGAVDPATSKPQTDAATLRRQSDSVSTADAAQAAALARAVQANVGMSHSARLAQVEGAIRAGSYQPSASALASRLLDAAEVDARLQALMRG